jgi:hypothetical protein
MRGSLALSALGPIALAACGGAEPVRGPVAEVIVVGELLSLESGPHCGGLHVSGIGRYRVVEVLSGSLGDPEISVAIPCPELSRPAYSSDAGSLQSFERGAVHGLELVRYETSVPARAPDAEFSGWYLLRADPLEPGGG